MTPPLGFITKQDRTSLQDTMHAQAESRMGKFAMTPITLAKGDKVLLPNFWKDPLVVADVGFVFPRAHQITGSCIGASLCNGIFTLSAVQRKLAVNPTKAFLNFWPFDYGRCRYNEGDRGQGEGAMNSSACDTMKTEGVLDANEPGLPQYTNNDGLVLTRQLEMQWSDGASPTVTKWANAAKKFPLGTAAPCRSAPEIVTGNVNGYPFYFGCDYYVGSGRITGSGDLAYVTGKFDGRGGHSTCILGVWNHPNDGMLYLYQNNWPAMTYPTDPAGGSPCSVWLPESEVNKIWSRYNGDAYLLSHLNYFPAQPEVLDFLV